MEVAEDHTLEPVPDGDRTTRRVDLLMTALLVGLVTLFFADVLFGSSCFYARDLTRNHFPMKAVVRRIVLGGEFPWWNPYYSGGQPMAANPVYEIFYPPQWLIFLPDFMLGYKLHILFHIYLVTISMYLLLRSLRLGVVGSMFGAISWGLGGVVLSVTNLLPTLFAAAWMPLLFLFVRRALCHFRWRDAAAAALVGGIQILVGEPAILLETWLVIGVYAVWKMWRDRRVGAAYRRIPLIIIVVFSWCIAAGSVQLIPALDHARDTGRSSGMPLEQVVSWSFPPARFLELVNPYLFGYADDGGHATSWGQRLYEERKSPFIYRIYQGALIVPLLLAGLATRGTKRWELTLLSAPFLLFALGRHFFVIPWLYRLGIRLSLRFPERLMITVTFLAIVYSSSILDRIVREDRVLLRRAIIVCAALVGVVALATLVTRTQTYETWFFTFASPADSTIGARMLLLSRRGWMSTLVTTLLATAPLIAIRLRRNSAALWQWTIVGVLALELLVINYDTAPRTTQAIYDPPPVTGKLDPHRDGYRIFHQMDWYEGTRWAAGFRQTGKGMVWADRNGMYPMLPAAWGFRTVLERDWDMTRLRATDELVASMWTLISEKREGWERFLLPVSNVRYVAVPRPFDEEMSRIHGRLWEMEPADFVEVPTLPRYFFANALRRVRDEREFTGELKGGIPDPRTAFVDLEPFSPAPGRVLAVDEHSSSIEIHTTSEGKSFLVLSVTPNKYWRATVDQAPATLHVTDVGYQGLVVPAGEHRIEVTYSNPLTIGFGVVSILAFMAAALTLVRAAASHRQNLVHRRI